MFNDENHQPGPALSVKAQKHSSSARLQVHVQACATQSGTGARGSNSILGVLCPQGHKDSWEAALAASQQLDKERQRSAHLQSELQHAQQQLQHQQQQIADAATREADLQQQLAVHEEQLQRAHRKAAAANAARQKAAVDCNHSAGIALRRLDDVQRLQCALQQQAQQLSHLQQQLQEVTLQLSYSRKLHAHTAALLSVRELQLAEALEQLQQQGTQPTATEVSGSAVQPQQQSGPAVAPLPPVTLNQPTSSVSEGRDVSPIAQSAVAHASTGPQVLTRCASNCTLSSAGLSANADAAEPAEEGTSTPVACHPARPSRLAVNSSRYRSSRLSLVDQFEAAAAAAADEQHSIFAGEQPPEQQEKVSDSERGDLANSASSAAAVATGAGVSKSTTVAKGCRWLNKLLHNSRT